MRILHTAVAVSLSLASLTAQGLVGVVVPGSAWPHPAAPTGNPFPRDGEPGVEKRDQIAQLGKALFWEEQVSTDNTVSCGTCHRPANGGTDGRPGGLFHDPLHPSNQNNGNVGSFGVIAQRTAESGGSDYGATGATSADRQVTEVAAPSMIGAYLFDKLFWNMRAGPAFLDENDQVIPGFASNAALEMLAVAPPTSSVEMGHEGIDWSGTSLAFKLGTAVPLAMVAPATIPPDVLWVTEFTDYDAAFDHVFGDYVSFGGELGVTRERFAMAVAHYQRTLIPDQAPIDLGEMTPEQLHGFAVMDAARCFNCHSAGGSVNLVNGRLVNPFDSLMSNGILTSNVLMTGETMQPARKTATLRNAGLHARFFSNGLTTGHADLLAFYQSDLPTSGPLPQPGIRFPELTTIEEADVADFLFNALTDPRVAAELPPFDRPTLYSETVTFGGNLFGTATPAPGAAPTAMIANAPALVTHNGAPQWIKIGLANANPGDATLVLFSLSKGQGSPGLLGDPVFVDAGSIVGAEGFATYHQPAPLQPSLIGVPLHFQWISGQPGNESWSNGATLLPFRF